MNEIPNFSPGCFGSALAYDADDGVCRGCVFATQCQPKHEEAKLALRARFGILEPETRRRKIETPVSGDPATMSLPKKVRELIERFDSCNLRIVERLSRGENPFSSDLPFMQMVCHLLLNFPKPLNRELLAAAFVRKCNWRQSTAEAHARMAIQALTHIGAVHNNDGAITLRRD